MGVGLGPRRGEVGDEVADANGRGAEALVRARLAPQRSGDRADVALDDDVDVGAVLAAEQQVADRAADEVGRGLPRRLADPLEARQGRQRRPRDAAASM